MNFLTLFLHYHLTAALGYAAQTKGDLRILKAISTDQLDIHYHTSCYNFFFFYTDSTTQRYSIFNLFFGSAICFSFLINGIVVEGGGGKHALLAASLSTWAINGNDNVFSWPLFSIIDAHLTSAQNYL